MGPVAMKEIRQTTIPSTSYPVEPQLPRTYGLRPWSPGRHRVSYTWRTASEGGGPGRYGRPGPPDRSIPSPNRHLTPLGSAVTVIVSPARETVSSSVLGAGSSQNQDVAPVRPITRGVVRMRPGERVRRSATEAAIATGSSPGPPEAPPGPTI